MWSKVGTIKLKKGVNRLKLTDIKPDARIDSIYIGVYPPFPKPYRQIIAAGEYISKYDSDSSRITCVRQLGFNNGVLVQPFDTPSYDIAALDKAPAVEYEVTLETGINEIEIRTLPTLHIYEGREARYAIQFGDEDPLVQSIHTDDFSAEWRWNVLRGYSCRRLNVNAPSKGNYRLRLYFMDPGIVLQEIRVL